MLPLHLYTPAVACGVLPPSPTTGEVCVSFDLPEGAQVRLRLPPRSVEFLVAALQRSGQCGAQSAMSHDSPSVEQSTPPAGQSQ
jgi:hypothetical protein